MDKRPASINYDLYKPSATGPSGNNFFPLVERQFLEVCANQITDFENQDLNPLRQQGFNFSYLGVQHSSCYAARIIFG
jgi:hypothetical protein